MFGKHYDCLLLPFHCSLQKQRFINSKNARAEKNFRESVCHFPITESRDRKGILLEGSLNLLVLLALLVDQINKHTHASLIVVSLRMKIHL